MTEDVFNVRKRNSIDVVFDHMKYILLLFIYTPRKDERLSWPSWLTCSRRFTHISGYISAAGRPQDRKSLPAKDRRSTTVLRNQPEAQSMTPTSRLASSFVYPLSDF